MNINIGENLKELRKKKNNTQEDLAEFLTVSITAVSKWERGECYPDIEFLPRIASYYDISVDNLLGVGEIKKQERIEEYLKKSEEIYEQFGYTEQKTKKVDLWREAQKEFPNNHTVLYQLMISLWWKVFVNEHRPYSNSDEIIEIGERLLRESTDTNMRSDVITKLSETYRLNDDIENAKVYLNMIPSFLNSREMLYYSCLDGEDRIKENQMNIYNFIHPIYQTFIHDMYWVTSSSEERIKLCEFALKFYQMFFPDGDFGFYESKIFDILHKLAVSHSSLGNVDTALSYLEEMAEHFIKFYTHGEFKHTSFLFNRTTECGYQMPKAYTHGKVSSMIKEIEDEKSFDNIRTDTRYTAVLNKITTLLQ